MSDHPQQSRCGPPLLVGGLTENEALQLLSHLGLGPEVANQGVDYVGTSLLLLERFAGLVHASGDTRSDGGDKNLNNVKAKLLELAALEFEAIGAVGGADNKENQPIVDAVKAVLGAGSGASLSLAELTRIIPNGEMRRKLLSSAILKYDSSSKSVGFASKLAEEAATQLLGDGKGGGDTKKKK
jgi:hypothetical protein